MNGKNFLSLILAALTISSFFVSCKGDIGTKIDAPVAYQTDRIEENNENSEITSYVTDLASKVDGNGKTFKFVGFSREEDGNIPIKEEETGNIVSDAVYRRQREIEEAFCVDWINVPTGDGDDTVPIKYGVEHMWELFVNNRALFYFDGSITDLRKEEVKFGVLPYPKGDDLQERYYSYTGGSMCVYFPKTVSDTALTGAVTEAAAALGHIYLKEACYEKMLKSQSVFDMESRDMLDIISNSQIADLAPDYSGGDVNWSGEFLTMLDDAISLSSKNFASSYVSKSKASNIYLKQFIKRIDKQMNR